MVKSLARVISAGVLRVVIYARVSKDRRHGASVKQQISAGQADLAELAEDLGVALEVVAIESDNDVGVSEYSVGERVGWPRTLALMGSGAVDLLWTWEHSRSNRDLEIYLEIRRACRDNGVLWRYSERTYDMSKWQDRKATARDAVDAEAESGQTSERIGRDLREQAVERKPHGRRLYGYRRVRDSETGQLLGQEPDEWEASVVRFIFDAFVKGVPRNTIAQMLNKTNTIYVMFGRPSLLRAPARARGEEVPKRAPWCGKGITNLLRNPGYCGRRVHKGELIDGVGWTPIVSEDTFALAQARLDARPPSTRQFLDARILTGLAYCGLCGSKLGATQHRSGYRAYSCKVNYHLSRKADGPDGLEEFVEARFLAHLATLDTEDLGSGGPDPALLAAQDQVAAAKKELAEAWELWDAGDLTVGAFARIEKDLKRRIEDAERRERRVRVPLDLDLPPSDQIIDWWSGLHLAQQREYLAALIESVVVLPIGRGIRGYDHADYTEITWRR